MRLDKNLYFRHIRLPGCPEISHFRVGLIYDISSNNENGDIVSFRYTIDRMMSVLIVSKYHLKLIFKNLKIKNRRVRLFLGYFDLYRASSS